MMDPSYRVIARPPTPDEYRRLCESAGWMRRDWEAMPTALANSEHAVVAVCGADVVGMARLIGDGIKFFFVEDVVVLPEHRGRGVGRLLLDAIVAYVDEHLSELALVNLMPEPGTAPFYERCGFAARPADAPAMRLLPRDRRG